MLCVGRDVWPRWRMPCSNCSEPGVRGKRLVFSSKTLLITGGTGTFGNAVLRRFLDTDISEIRVFSRDERRQDKTLGQPQTSLS